MPSEPSNIIVASVDMDDEAKQILLDAGLDERTLSIVLNYVRAIDDTRNRMAKAQNVEELVPLIAENILAPIEQAATSSFDTMGPVFSVLYEIDSRTIEEDILAACLYASFDCSPSDIDAADVITALDALIYQRSIDSDNPHVRAYLHDIHERRTRGLTQISMPETVRIKSKFMARIKSSQQNLDKQARILDTMSKHCHSIDDVEIWFSRFLLANAIDAAKKGDLLPLSRCITKNERYMREELAFCAKHCGYEVDPSRFDMERVWTSIYSFCRSRTGGEYSVPREYLGALLSKESSQ